MNPWEKSEDWLRPGRFAAILAAMVLIQFPMVVLGASTFFFRDYGFFGYPLAQYHRDAFWSGEIPFWNPYNNAGLPFLAQWNTMVLYPGSLIYLLLPMPWSLGIFCLFHQFLAGLGMYFLGRDTSKSNLGGAVAGIAFAFCGLLLCSLKWPNNIAAFGLMPWVVWRCLRAENSRTLGIAALIGGAQMLSGAPEVILLTWVIIGVMTLGEAITQRSPRPLLILAGIVALVSAIAAAQLWPFLDLLKLSQRTTTFAGSDWPMPIWGWLNFLIPTYGTFPSYHGVSAQPNQYWISTYYVPIVALAFAAFSLKSSSKARLAFGLAIFCAILALGEPGKLYALLRQIVPGLGFMRFPIKFVIVPVFIFSWLGAIGFAKFRESQKTQTFLAELNHPYLTLLFVVSPFILGRIDGKGDNSNFGSGWDRVFVLLLFASISTWMAKTNRPALILTALISIVWLDGRTHAPEQNPTAAKWVFDRGLPQITNAPTLGLGRAMISSEAALKLDHIMFAKPEDDIGTSRLALFCNANLIDRIPKVDGFFSLYIRESAQLVDLMYADTNRIFPGLEKAFAVSHVTAPAKTGDWLGVDRPSWIHGVENVVSASRAETIRALIDPAFDPGKTLYLPIEETNALGVATIPTIEEVIWSPDKISFTVIAKKRAWILLGQAFHPGWHVRPQGRSNWDSFPAFRIQRANHAFQALLVPEGVFRLDLCYEEPHFFEGALISIAGILTCLFLICFKAKRP